MDKHSADNCASGGNERQPMLLRLRDLPTAASRLGSVCVDLECEMQIVAEFSVTAETAKLL